jgi:molybdate/tungstate transport system substrate-binding protein
MKNRRLKLSVVVAVAILFVLAGIFTFPSRSRAKKELIIFHAGSLSVPFREISAEFEKMYPDITVKPEAAGSRACARKITDLGRQCDIMGSADYKVVENLLMPDYVDFNIRFALNEMVIAYTDRSRMGDNVSADNWHDVLLNDDIFFGRSDPDLDPCGYRTLMVFQLAEKHYAIDGLAAALSKKDKYIRPKETDLLALLEAGEIDYLFIYRSVATQHGLKMIMLPDQINLKSRAFADLYRTAVVQVSGKTPDETIAHTGEPMVYSVTICRDSPNAEAAQAWVALLLSETGRSIMERSGQPCIAPAAVDTIDKLPQMLRKFCKQ